MHVTVMTSLVVHEAGHALAASCEGVRVETCGIFVWVLVPGAFVRLDLDDATAPLKRVLHPLLPSSRFRPAGIRETRRPRARGPQCACMPRLHAALLWRTMLRRWMRRAFDAEARLDESAQEPNREKALREKALRAACVRDGWRQASKAV